MKAVKIAPPGQAVVVDNAPIPELPSPEWVRVKVIAVGLNPTDWMHVEGMKVPATVGCDFSGIVDEVGAAVTNPVKKGDRIFAMAHGSNSLRPDNGSFAEFVCVKGAIVMKIPEGRSFEEFAGSGVGIITVGQGMYQEMPLPWPTEPLKEKKPLLIWGGSSGMGAMGIQFAKLSGFEVLAACSPKNFDYVKLLGADHVFDAYDPEVGKKIRDFTNNKLYYAWDCIGKNGAPRQCADALAASAPPGQSIHYGGITKYDTMPREDVVYSYSIGYSAEGEDWDMGWTGIVGHVQGSKEHYEWMKKWVAVVVKLLAEDKWKPHRQEVRSGGFEGILQGLEDMKNGKVSGAKLTYRVADP